MLRDSSGVDENELSRMGLSEAPSTALQVPRTHNRGRRASEGMIDLRRGTLPPLPNKISSVKVLNGQLSKLSVSPVVTLAVNDDETMPSSSQRVFTRRGSSPWSKTTSSSPSSPQSLLSASHPVLAPSPPRSVSPCPSPSNFSQARHRRFRRGSLPASTLSPTSPKTFTDWKSGFSIPKQNSQMPSSNEIDRVDHNSNVLHRENVSVNPLSKNRALSPYPHSCRPPAFRRRSDGAIQTSKTSRDHSHQEKSSNSNPTRNLSDTQNKTIFSKVPNNDHRLRHRNSDSAVVIKVTRPQTRRPDQQALDYHHDRGFVPISKNENVVGNDDDSSVYDFDDNQDDEARQWILNWLDGVEKSAERTPTVALDDLCHYNETRETAIKVFYDSNGT